MRISIPLLSLVHRARLREMVLFAIVGVMNTVIDFSVLNLLIALSGHHSDLWLLVFNSLSFLAAVINSYIMNGRVTFRQNGLGDPWKFSRFIAVNALGLAINSGIVWLISPLLSRALPPVVAINISKGLATFVSLCWSYLLISKWIFRNRTRGEGKDVPEQPLAVMDSTTRITV